MRILLKSGSPNLSLPLHYDDKSVSTNLFLCVANLVKWKYKFVIPLMITRILQICHFPLHLMIIVLQ